MNVLIVGGAGFLGTNLVRRCLFEPNASVTVLDSLDPNFQSTTQHLQSVWDRITFVQGDMRDEKLISKLVRGRDVIFNCAAQTSHPLSIENPLLDAQINCLGNLTLLEAVRKQQPSARVIYTSSTTVIGRTDDDQVDERHNERPLDIYSANKGVAEKYYRIYHTAHGLNTTVLRLPNLFGPFGKSDAKFGFINYFISLAWANHDIPIFGSGEQTRNVMDVSDAVDVLMLAVNEPKLVGDIWMATGEENLPVHEIARVIVETFQRGRVHFVDWPEQRLRIEVGAVRYRSQRLHEMLGWRPRYTLREGLLRLRRLMEAGDA